MTFLIRLGVVLGLAAGMATWLLWEKPSPAAPTSPPSAHPPSVRGRVTRDREPEPLADEEIDSWLKQAGRDTPGTLAKVMELTNAEERGELLDWIFSAWTAEDRGPALEWLEKSLPQMREESAAECMELLIGGWSQEQPLEAMAWVNARLHPPARQSALVAVASNWAASDPEAMGHWITEQKDLPDFWTQELIHGLIPDNPAGALAWCDRLVDPALGESMRQTTIQSWQLSHPEAAAAYLKEHPALVPDIQPESPPPPAEEE